MLGMTLASSLSGYAVRLTVALRRRLAARDVSAFLAFALPVSSDAYARLTPLLPKVKF